MVLLNAIIIFLQFRSTKIKFRIDVFSILNIFLLRFNKNIFYFFFGIKIKYNQYNNRSFSIKNNINEYLTNHCIIIYEKNHKNIDITSYMGYNN